MSLRNSTHAMPATVTDLLLFSSQLHHRSPAHPRRRLHTAVGSAVILSQHSRCASFNRLAAIARDQTAESVVVNLVQEKSSRRIRKQRVEPRPLADLVTQQANRL